LAEALPATAPESVELRVGPEGGLTDDEVAQWVGSGAVAVHLGPRILRTETAALAAVSRLIGHYRL